MKYLLSFTLCLFLFSCGSDDDDQLLTIPFCIDQEITNFENQACFGSGDLTKWNFDGEDVFCFNEGTCIPNSQAFIYDASCNLICVLGGVQENEICDGIVFATNSSLIGTIYRY